jgi:beta-glucan synthesis-associated protein KRE6
VTTRDGSLIIQTTAEKTSWDEWDSDAEKMVTRTRNYTSGMVQTWNKFCFTGGVLELSIQLPGGDANAGGKIVFLFITVCLSFFDD